MAESNRAASPPPGAIKVTFAREWTIRDKTYQPDEEALLSSDDADEVLRYGYARPEDPAVAKRYGFSPGPTIIRKSDKKGGQ